MEKDLILVTDWELVDIDDFYLTDEWEGEDKERIEAARKLQKQGRLYVGYIVPALDYCIYSVMDADQVFIDSDMEVFLHCEVSAIRPGHDKCIEYTY